nr:RNA-directed DNA polymerase, eukaryota [Tanacetum cinerariifolium]
MEKAKSNRYMSDLKTSKISLQSKFDQTSKISKSVIISNFPDDCTNRDLWKVLLSNEGFHNARIVYLGGLWVMIELKSSKTKLKFTQHVGVASWFHRLCNAQSDFAAKERIVWGEMVELEDGYDDLFARKKICIKTSQTENILESFKIIVKGKVFWARAKELFVWSPSFKEVLDKVMCLDDESVKINEEANSLNNGVKESDSEVVLDTYFGDNGEDQGLEHQHGESSNAKEVSNTKEVSSDPFNIYGLLDKRTKEVRTTEEVAIFVDISSSESINNEIKLKEGGSILEILEDMITVGQTMRFSMEGCTKDMEKIIGTQEEQLEGYSFTWAHPSATKMSKLDRFLMSNVLLSSFPHILAICLDRHLSDHRPILLREVISDFGPTPLCFYHSWLDPPSFDELVTKSWNSFVLDDSNGMIRFKKSGVTDDILLSRMEVLKQLHDVQSSNNRDIVQKAKIRWAIEGDENSKYFHVIINKKRANLSVKGIMVDGDWIDDPDLVKHEFRSHFADRFQDPGSRRDLESSISKDEIRTAVWGCGVDKSPGPDGFTFEFFHKYWAVVGPDFSIAVKWFFEHGDFAIGCNSSFVALIPKVLDLKVVSDYRPISLIGNLYKVVTKILATRLSLVISDLISDVDFAKAYDSIRWDFLDDVLISFGFESKWRLWICGSDNMSSIKAWDEPISKMKKRLSRWKLNTLSVGGRITFLKSMLGSTPIYNMSIFKVPKSILNLMESLRRNFFNGIQDGDRKIAWVKWSKVLASKKYGGLGVSSFYALNWALLFKWVGKGTCTSFWNDLWIGDSLLKLSFPRLYALEEKKHISVADKMRTSISFSFRRPVRGGVESQQHDHLSVLLDSVILSNMEDRWFWDLNVDGVFRVKDVQIFLDEAFLPKMEVPTRWIKSIPIK